ncbi:leucine-rich repeat domain-containing protein [Aureliella helgolandensis]|uniref:Leucine Rich repeats (2 copies) n=1 Tax=Aureliella helgolandensis TaxID=2527968 RepID=A0A518G7E3_9BACT|nr:leucine-rich repeat domain-containing protein [Aureliella helgolandensis]QDV24501.1 hypothetical protein Q31a_28190 [Aureliella helgolandensis]
MSQETENSNHPELDGPLKSAVWAVLSTPVPADAVERVKQRARVLAVDSQSAIDRKQPRMRSSQILRLCLAASILAIVVGGFAWFNIPFTQSSVYAQVAERLEKIRSIVCYVQFSETGALQQSQDQFNVQKVSYLAPSLHRIENDQLGTIRIVDREKQNSILLMSESQQAIVVNGPAAAAMDVNSPARLIESLMRHIRVDRAREAGLVSLGTQTLGGVELEGYESTLGGETVRAWFDVETLLPKMVALRFEIPAHMADGNAVRRWRVMSKIEVDVDVSPDLFSTEVPVGYETLAVDIPWNQSSAELADVIEMLRLCAVANDSKFPLRLSVNDALGSPLAIQSKFAAALEKQFNEGNDAERAAALQKVQEFGSAVGRAMAFQFSIKPENAWNYFGGAQLNEADRPILWYSPDADDNFKVLYADLTVQDVTRDNLPAKPQAVVNPSKARNSIRVSTPNFSLPSGAIREYALLEKARREGTQFNVEYLSLGWMPEFIESQIQYKPGEEIVMQVVDPKWKPQRDPNSSRLAFLGEFTNLKGLDLSHLYLTQADLDQIASCLKLERLSLSGVKVFDSSSHRLNGEELAKFSTLRSLELLDLSQVNFLGGLTRLADLPNLHTLYLSSFEHINDASIAEISVLPNLETLVLAPVYGTNPETTVTETGLESLKNIRRLKTLFVGYHGEWTLPIDRLPKLLPDVDVRSPTEGAPPSQ